MSTIAQSPPAPGPWDVLSGPDEKAAMLAAYHARMCVPEQFLDAGQAQWEQRRKFVRRKVLECLGLWPLPKRLPLDPHITGVLERDGYRVERVYWQVWPKVYASGYLYVPTTGKPGTRYPVVLSPHGHWENGARNPTVQSRNIGLAKLGYVVLTPDSVHVTDFPIGLCSQTAMTWDNIRALDYLETRPEADMSRVGCTGASGGAQQTMFLTAVEDRIHVAVPVCMITYLRRILFPTEEAHCICNHVPGLMRYTDEPEMTAVFAPKPTLYLCVTQDWTAEFPKVEYPELQRVWQRYQAADRIDLQQWDWGHDYHQPIRERMYAWMERWLKGKDLGLTVPEPKLETESLETLNALSQPIPGAVGFEQLPAYFRRQHRYQEPDLGSRDGDRWRRCLTRLRGEVRGLLGEPVAPQTKPEAKLVSEGTQGQWRYEKLLLRTEPEIQTPGVLLLAGDGRRPCALVLHPAGKGELLTKEWELIESLLNAGAHVLALDPRLRGELHINWVPNCTIWGRPEVGMGVHDITAWVTYLRTRAEVEPTGISCLGLGEMGLWAVLAGGLDRRLNVVGADDIGQSYLDGRQSTLIPFILRHADLPQLAAMCCPRGLLIKDMGGGHGRFEFTVEAYTALRSGRLAVLEGASVQEARQGFVRMIGTSARPGRALARHPAA